VQRHAGRRGRGRLVGAVLLGPADWYAQVTRLIADQAAREVVERTLGLTGHPTGAGAVPQAFAWHCPICAAELAVPRGTAVGATMACRACNTRLRVRWEGDRGWVETTDAKD
jgi:hypothetical protein